MNGPLPLTRYSADLAFLNDRYDLMLSEPSAKAAYKKKRGYKIAWNWANEREKFFPGYAKRVERNRKQAVYRLTRKYDLSFLKDLSDGNHQYFSIVRNIMAGPYYVIGGSAVLNWMDTIEANGITVVLGTEYSEWEGISTYRDSLQREKAVRRMMRIGNEWQRKRVSDYPFVSFVSGAVKNINNLVYFLLTLTA